MGSPKQRRRLAALRQALEQYFRVRPWAGCSIGVPQPARQKSGFL
jgi:hypothetical protein